MTTPSPSDAALEVAQQLGRTLGICDREGQLFPSHLKAITAALLSFRRIALEEAAKVCERRIVITEHGERDIVIAEPSPEHAKSIRALAGSTKEGE